MASLEDSNDLQVRVLMYLGVLCSGILESLADVEKAAVAALSAPHHQKRVWPAIKRALHISSKKVDDPEDPSGTCSARKKQALHQTWLDMLSATNTAFQNGTDYPSSLDILMCEGLCIPIIPCQHTAQPRRCSRCGCRCALLQVLASECRGCSHFYALSQSGKALHS